MPHGVASALWCSERVDAELDGIFPVADRADGAPCWAAITLAQSIPAARLHVLEDGGGHLMLGEHPDIAAEINALSRSTQD